MPRFTRRALLNGAGAAFLTAGSGAACAQSASDWPSKPIRFVVNFGTAGATDSAARAYAERLARVLGQPVVVENKGGASGAIGAEVVVKSAPDGYTFLVTPGLPMVTLPHLRKLSFNPLTDLTPVASIVEGLVLLATNTTVPGSNLQEFVAYAKANPGKLAWGTTGVGTYSHFVYETFKHHAGVDILHVPYRSAGESMADLLANVVQIVSDPAMMQHVLAGKAKLHAILASSRRPDFPNVPMLKEVYPEIDFSAWFGILAPAGTPKAILNRLSAATNEVGAMSDVKTMLFGLALAPTESSPASTRLLLEGDYARFGRLIKQFDIRAE